MVSSMWAIIVGIERYKSDTVEPVTGAAQDVDRMLELFTTDMGVPHDQIIILKACICSQ
jgi:hypothetical protein